MGCVLYGEPIVCKSPQGSEEDGADGGAVKRNGTRPRQPRSLLCQWRVGMPIDQREGESALGQKTLGRASRKKQAPSWTLKVLNTN